MTDVFGATPSLNSALRRWEQRLPREVALLQRAAETTKSELARLTPHAPPPIIIHGDFTPWNLRFRSGGLSGILDWEFTHLDQRVADFALSWRGRHKDVIRGYEQESPLEEIECELLEPVRRAWLLDDARRTLLRDPDQQAPDLTWTLTHLARQPCQPPTA
jgi:Ser/Thr protein kinase RdoA (MazF antagonist)